MIITIQPVKRVLVIVSRTSAGRCRRSALGRRVVDDVRRRQLDVAPAMPSVGYWKGSSGCAGREGREDEEREHLEHDDGGDGEISSVARCSRLRALAIAPAASTASLPISGPSASCIALGFVAGRGCPRATARPAATCLSLSPCRAFAGRSDDATVPPLLDPSQEADYQPIYAHSAEAEAGEHPHHDRMGSVPRR